MPTVTIEKTISAEQQQVWEFIRDIETTPEWVEVMKSLIDTTENPVREGTVYRESSKIGPKASETEWRITRFEEPHTQVHACNKPDFNATLTMWVEDNGDGTSTLFHRTEYQLLPNVRPLGRLLESLFAKRLMEKHLRQPVDNCQRMIESNESYTE